MAENVKTPKTEDMHKLSRFLFTASFLMLNMAIMMCQLQIEFKFVLFAALWVVSDFLIHDYAEFSKSEMRHTEQVNKGNIHN